MTRRIDWRFRKGSEADPIIPLPCGCRYYCYNDMVVRYCEKHEKQAKAAGRGLTRKEVTEKPTTERT